MRAPVAGRRSGKALAPATFRLGESSDAHPTPTGTFESDVFTSDVVPALPKQVGDPERQGGGKAHPVGGPTVSVEGLSMVSRQPEGAIPSFLLDMEDASDAQGGFAAGLRGTAAGPAHVATTGPAFPSATTVAPRESNRPGVLSNLSAEGDNWSMPEPLHKANAREDEAARQVSLRKQRQDLQSELSTVNDALRASQANLDALNNGTHSLCLEVEALEKEKQSLLQEHVEMCKSRSEVEEKKCAVQNNRIQEKEIEAKAGLEEFSAKLHSEYHRELRCLQNEFTEREQRLQSIRRDLDEKKAHMLSSPHETAIQQLGGALLRLVEGIKSEFAYWVRPLLRESIATNITSANQQRCDIFRKDRDNRKEALHAYRDGQVQRFREFQDRHRAQMRRRRDTAFGELRQQWQSDQNARWLASQRRLAAHRVQIEAQTQRVRQAAEENIVRLREQGQRSVDALQEAYRAKELQLEKSLEGDFQNFVERAEAEKHSMISGRKLIRSSYDKVHFTGSGAVTSSGASSGLEEFKSSLGRIRSQVDQIRFSAIAEVHMLKVSSNEGDARDRAKWGGLEMSLGSDPACSLTKQLNRHESNMRPSLMKMHSTITEMQHALNTFSSALQSRQLQLGTLHDEVVSAKRVWDEDIQRRLSSSFLLGGDRDRQQPDLPFAEDLVREVLSHLRARLEMLMLRQSQLKCARQEHLGKLSSQLTQVQAEKDSSNTVLCSVLELYDKLGQTSGDIEVRRRRVEVSEADLVKAREQLEKEHVELTMKFKQLENFAYRLHKRSKMLRTVKQGVASHPIPYTGKGLIEMRGPLLTYSTQGHAILPQKVALSSSSEIMEGEEKACNSLSTDLSSPLLAPAMPSS